jgi:hypothetical protein
MSARTIQPILTGEALIRHNLRRWQKEQKLRLQAIEEKKHPAPQPQKFWHGGLVVVEEAINQATR